jgi:two-component system, OmpR family, KDP operon response regulator KdpE
MAMLDLVDHVDHVQSAVEPSPSILIVEHDAANRRSLRIMLEEQGYEVLEAATAHEGLSLCFTHPPHLVMIEQLLPDQGGIALTRQIRESSDVPIIMVSPRDDEDSHVDALDGGANDYVIRPYRERELLARVRAALRWGRPPGSDPFSVGDLRLDPAQRRVFMRGAEVNLTPTEYKLLAVLTRQAGRVVERRRESGKSGTPSSAEAQVRVYH